MSEKVDFMHEKTLDTHVMGLVLCTSFVPNETCAFDAPNSVQGPVLKLFETH